MAPFSRSWFLCGGWAVDAWLGQQTREHKDVDIAVFQTDQQAIFDHLRDWQLIAHDNVTLDSEDAWGGRSLELPAHIHANAEDGFELEVILEDGSADLWILSRQPLLSLPLSGCIRSSPWSLPAASPEVLLFFKATAFGIEGIDERPQDEADFSALVSRLDKRQSVWLRGAITLTHPGHPWLSRFSL